MNNIYTYWQYWPKEDSCIFVKDRLLDRGLDNVINAWKPLGITVFKDKNDISSEQLNSVKTLKGYDYKSSVSNSWNIDFEL